MFLAQVGDVVGCGAPSALDGVGVAGCGEVVVADSGAVVVGEFDWAWSEHDVGWVGSVDDGECFVDALVEFVAEFVGCGVVGDGVGVVGEPCAESGGVVGGGAEFGCESACFAEVAGPGVEEVEGDGVEGAGAFVDAAGCECVA